MITTCRNQPEQAAAIAVKAYDLALQKFEISKINSQIQQLLEHFDRTDFGDFGNPSALPAVIEMLRVLTLKIVLRACLKDEKYGLGDRQSHAFRRNHILKNKLHHLNAISHLFERGTPNRHPMISN
jgi:hypothetical protein